MRLNKLIVPLISATFLLSCGKNQPIEKYKFTLHPEIDVGEISKEFKDAISEAAKQADVNHEFLYCFKDEAVDEATIQTAAGKANEKFNNTITCTDDEYHGSRAFTIGSDKVITGYIHPDFEITGDINRTISAMRNVDNYEKGSGSDTYYADVNYYFHHIKISSDHASAKFMVMLDIKYGVSDQEITKAGTIDLAFHASVELIK
ncbi:MAG: hypothetical protein MJ206_03075 [Bacilli bacterium]|nr:hypothetical protein [Bacilli bacterium]